MCRLYGFRANEETKVECTLVHAQNALMLQSRLDRSGRSHVDGWGLAFYHDTVPEVERRSTAAFEDLYFDRTAERIYSRTVVAHVRSATVGVPAPANSHPFVWGCWAFAHNGTVQAFDKLCRQLEKETLSHFQEYRRGQTDSEQLFLWLMSRLAAADVDLAQPTDDGSRLDAVVGESLGVLARRCDQAGADKPAKLNIILTDGRRFVAVRWNNSLYYVLREGIHDCEICGVPHVRHRAAVDYRAVIVASEPISDEPWIEVPNHSVLSADDRLDVRVVPIETAGIVKPSFQANESSYRWIAGRWSRGPSHR